MLFSLKQEAPASVGGGYVHKYRHRKVLVGGHQQYRAVVDFVAPEFRPRSVTGKIPAGGVPVSEGVESMRDKDLLHLLISPVSIYQDRRCLS